MGSLLALNRDALCHSHIVVAEVEVRVDVGVLYWSTLLLKDLGLAQWPFPIASSL